MRKISDKIFIGGILLASLSVIFLLALIIKVNAQSVFPITFDYNSASNGQTSTNGTYTWTVPAGVTQIQVEVWGGGGAGSVDGDFGADGGGGGGYRKVQVQVTPGTTYNVVVGRGGVMNDFNNEAIHGEASVFSNLVTAFGGRGEEWYGNTTDCVWPPNTLASGQTGAYACAKGGSSTAASGVITLSAVDGQMAYPGGNPSTDPTASTCGDDCGGMGGRGGNGGEGGKGARDEPPSEVAFPSERGTVPGGGGGGSGGGMYDLRYGGDGAHGRVIISNATPASSFIDIGLRVKEVGITDPTPIAIESQSTTPMSPLRIAKNGVIYGVALVDPSSPDATKALIALASGQIKALRRFTVESGQTSVNFDDQYTTASGYCVMQGSEWGMVFYGKITITNPSSIRADFTKIAIDPAGNESVRNSFSIPANSTVVIGGFGQIGPYPPCGDTQVPPPYYGMGGSADYEVRQNGTLIDTVRYSWDYTL